MQDDRKVLSTAEKVVLIALIIVAILLDFDDTLGKTERKAFTACTGLINEILRCFRIKKQFTVDELLARFRGRSFQDMILELGKEHGFLVVTKVLGGENLDVTESVLAQFTGRPYSEMVDALRQDHLFTVKSVRLEDGREMDLAGLVKEEMERVISLFERELEPTDGVNEVLALLAPWFDLSIVSSSAWKRLMASLTGTNQLGFFNPVEEHVYSGTTHLVIPRLGKGKPAPDIYNLAMKRRGVRPDQCVGVEDSNGGMDSLFAANVLVKIGYVGIYPIEEQASHAAELRQHGADAILFSWKYDEFIDAVYSVLVAKGKLPVAA